MIPSETDKSRMLNLVPMDTEDNRSLDLSNAPKPILAKAPESYEIAEEFLTPVRNQHNCGSCVAFATVAALETCILMNGKQENTHKLDNEVLDLSEQRLIDCGHFQ